MARRTKQKAMRALVPKSNVRPKFGEWEDRKNLEWPREKSLEARQSKETSEP